MREEVSLQEISAPSHEGASPAEPPAPSRAGGQTPSVVEELERLEPALLQRRWRSVVGRPAPQSLSRQLMIRILVFREQIACVGDIDAGTRAALANALNDSEESSAASAAASALRPGSVLVRDHLCAFLRTLATPEPIKEWSLTTLRGKLIKIGAKVVTHSRYVAFQLAEVAIPRACSRTSCG
jgi:Protein of unknown function (DUF2924)/Transposase DDE domain group 1